MEEESTRDNRDKGQGKWIHWVSDRPQPREVRRSDRVITIGTQIGCVSLCVVRRGDNI